MAASVTAQNVAINETGTAPDPSAQLDVQSTTRGMLVPCMTTTQRTTIASPANGLLVFDTTTGTFWFYSAGSWAELVSSSKGLRDADNDTRVEVEAAPDEDVIRFTVKGNQIAKLDSTTLHLEAPGGSLFIGKDAGIADDGSSNYNIFIGHQSGISNTSGYNNVGVGFQSLFFNAQGYNNTAIGLSVLANNTSGWENTGVGKGTMFHNTTGTQNSGFGAGALFDNTTGYHNAATGVGALLHNTEGYENTADGWFALAFNLTGSRNTASGAGALYNSATASYNAAIGYKALVSDTSGSHNVAIGARALYLNTDRSELVALGDSALYYNGTNAMAPEEASGNTAVGAHALLRNTSGYYNTATGWNAMHQNLTGYLNTAAGFRAMESRSAGSLNTAQGALALFADSTGSNNTAIGAWALKSIPVGSGNTAVGSYAGWELTYGNNNTFIGYNAGLADGLFNASAIGYEATVECNNCMALGGLDDNAVNIGLNTTTPAASIHVKQRSGIRPWRMEYWNDTDYWEVDTDYADDWNFYYDGSLKAYITDTDGTYYQVSDRRLKKDIRPIGNILNAFTALRPVTYLMKDSPGQKRRSIGLIAQEVEPLFPDMVLEKDGIKTINYTGMTVLAIHAIQELTQENAELKETLKELDARIQKLESTSNPH